MSRFRYLAGQRMLAETAARFVRVGHRLVGGPRPEPPPEALAFLQKSLQDLYETDLANVEAGLYPESLLFQIPVAAYARTFPELLLDSQRVRRRMQKNAFAELPEDVALENYPAYYRRTFHWQTDGWLSKRSARLYDVGVELLFGGTADVMRRQALPPLVRALRGKSQPRLLDVACGTGRFLLQAHAALPQAKLYGLDMSPFYVAHARKLLRDVPDASFVAENAEKMPFADGTFDAVSSVFLFHEVPKDVRRNILREMARVVVPSGTVVLADSAQVVDTPLLACFLAQFSALYHEPYHKGYVEDDLAAAAEECGLSVESHATHFLTRVVVCKKTRA